MVGFNFGQGIQGAGAGGMAGFQAGGGLGGILGALTGLFGGGFGSGRGKPGKFEQLPTMNPEQQQLLSQLMEMLGSEGELGQGYGEGLSQLKELMDPSSEASQRFADPYMKQFQQQTLPGIAERFAGAGAQGGALSSSGFGQAVGGAGADLQSNLAGLKSQLQRGSIQDILGQFQGLLGKGLGAQSFRYNYREPTGSYAQKY